MKCLLLVLFAQRISCFSTQSALFDPMQIGNERYRVGVLDASVSRMFNLNEKGGPFGLNYNAEIWNGRVAQLSFAWVFGQEWMQGKGMLQGIKEQDPGSVIALGLFMTLVGFLSLRFVVEPPIQSFQSVDKMKLSHPMAYRHAKSFMEMFDPQRDPEEMTVNFNDQGGPFGLKKNAEIWNGRIAMETLSGQGILAGIENQDDSSLAALACFLTLLTGFTGFMKSEEKDEKDFVEKVVSIKSLRENAAVLDWKPETVDRPYEPIPHASAKYAVSEPPTYEVYMRERARIVAAEKALEYEESLREMTKVKPESPPPPTYQVIQASNPSPKWEVSFSDSLRAMTSERPKSQSVKSSVEVAPKIMDEPPPRKVGEVAAPPMIIAATPHTQTKKVDERRFLVQEKSPVSSLPARGQRGEIDNSMRAYDSARWSFELAELWNGRFAQIAFVVVFSQELIQGKGVLRGIELGDSLSLAGMLATFLAIVGTGVTFVLGQEERNPATMRPPPARKDPGLLRQLQTRHSDGSTGSLSSAASSVASDAEKAREIRPKKRLSDFKVDGYRFKPEPQPDSIGETETFIPSSAQLGWPNPLPNSARPLPEITAEEKPFAQEQPRTSKPKPPPGFVITPDPSDYKVPGYRFKTSPQSAAPISPLDMSPHPEGVFTFNSGNTRQIRIGTGQPKTPKETKASPNRSNDLQQAPNQAIVSSDFRSASVPPLPVVDAIDSPSFPKKIDVVGGPSGSEYAINEQLYDNRVGSWITKKEGTAPPDDETRNPVMVKTGGFSYLESLSAEGGKSSYRP